MFLSEGSKSVIKCSKNQDVIILLRLKATNKKIILVVYTFGNKLLEEKIVIYENIVVTRM